MNTRVNTALTINNYDNHLVISPIDQSNLVDHVPAMVYKATIAPQGIILIKDRKSFDLPQLRFGKHNRYFKQITGGYDRTSKSTGVLLSGEKGSGKSLLAEELGNWMIRQDIPVIMISHPMGAEELSLIIRAVGPCMVYFDEFGKVYNEQKDRERLLTLFSDTSFTGVMFVITGNTQEEFSDYLYNRPQRFRYAIDYGRVIDRETVTDVLTTMKVNPIFHELLYVYTQNGGCRNIDSLMCVVRETAAATSIEDLHDRCEILNVSKLPVEEWHIKEVKIAENVVEGLGYRINIYQRNPEKATVDLFEHDKTYQSFGDGPKSYPIDISDKSKDIRITIRGQQTYLVTVGYGYDDFSAVVSKVPVNREPRQPFALNQSGAPMNPRW